MLQRPFTLRTLLSLGFILMLTMALGCQADDDVLKGDIGEFCNNNVGDCRDGLACIEGICDTAGPQPLYSCQDVCDKLGSCDAAERNCFANCRVTVQDWSQRAQEEFGACVVIDLSCDEARESDVPQTCYSRIEIPVDRQERCSEFVSSSRACGASDLQPLGRACNALARVGTDADWQETDPCVDALNSCAELETCLNATMDINPELRFGNVMTDVPPAIPDMGSQ